MASAATDSSLEGAALAAWRSYLQSHASILRVLDADLVAEHGITTRDYEVLLYLAQAEGEHLPMSALAESTMLTRSGITRLVDGLVGAGLIERVACPNDARVSYAQLTDRGRAKLREAGCAHVRSIRRLFLESFTPEEIEQLASLLGRLPGAQGSRPCTADRRGASGCEGSPRDAACPAELPEPLDRPLSPAGPGERSVAAERPVAPR